MYTECNGTIFCNESLFNHLPLGRNTLQFKNKIALQILQYLTVYLCLIRLISLIAAESVAASASANAISYQDWSGLKGVGSVQRMEEMRWVPNSFNCSEL